MIISDKKIKCVQINLQRSKSATAHLTQHIEEHDIDIVIIQEPYVMKQKVCGFPLRYRQLYKNDCEKPKTAIIITNPKIESVFTQTYSNEFLTIAIFEFNSKNYAIISAYCSPAKDIDSELNYLQTVINELQLKNFIICIDSNAHSKIWFNKREDVRGEYVLDFVSQNNAIIMNRNDFGPTYESYNGKSTIDLTILSSNLINYVNDWHIPDIESQSDHKYIAFNIGDKCENILYKNTLKYNVKRADWNSLLDDLTPVIERLNCELININNANQLHNFVERFDNELTYNCDKWIPKLNNNNNHNKRKGNDWWSEELEKLRLGVNSARRRYQRCKTRIRNELEEVYNALKLEYQKLINESKIKSWNNFIENNMIDNPWGIAYKIANEKLIQQNPCELRSLNDNLIINRQQIAEYLLDSLFPIDDMCSDSEYHVNIRLQSNIINNNSNDICFSVEEVTQVISAQNPKKAPGEDGFTAEIIKRLHSINRNFLTNLYNKCLELSIFPNIWKTSIVKVLQKPNKPDYRDPNSYRPISLLSVFTKILEKLLINRIMDLLRKNNQISANQYGFTPQRCTEDALHSLKNFIKNAYNKKGFALVISLDISGAFNYCWWPKVLNQLRIKGCPNNLLALSRSYFSNRKSKIWYLNREYMRTITVGCPQGSASGPWFWNVCYDDIFDIANKFNNVCIDGFADDTIIKIYANNTKEIQTIANEVLKEIEIWAYNNKLIFNVDKTNCVLFTNNQKYDSPNIEFKGQQLVLKDKLKHLGVIFDSKLNWRSHVNYVKQKAEKLINNLLRFGKVKFGLNSGAMEVIYKGAVLPMVGYAISVWSEAIDQKLVTDTLNALQRRYAIRQIKGYRTLSTDAANVVANMIPIDIWLKSRALEYFMKKNIANNLTEHYFANTDITIENIQRPIDVRTLQHFGKREKIPIFGTNECYYNVYINSEKNNVGTGGAYCIYANTRLIKQKKIKVAKYCSLFQTNLFALKKSLDYIKTKESDQKRFALCLRDQTLIKALEDQNSTNPLICKIYENFYSAKEKGKAIGIYVDSDGNSDGNKLSKTLAKNAITSHNRIEFDLIPKQYVKRTIIDRNIEIWEERWQSTGKGPQTKLFFPHIRDRIEAKKYWKHDFYLTQAVTSHGKMNAYLARFGIRRDAHCEYCGHEIDDANHRIYDCIIWTTEREQMIRRIESEGMRWPLEQRILISDKIFNIFREYCTKIFN